MVSCDPFSIKFVADGIGIASDDHKFEGTPRTAAMVRDYPEMQPDHSSILCDLCL